MICMKKTLNIDAKLLADARAASHAATDTDTIRLGLEALVRQAAYQRLRAFRGSETMVLETRRRYDEQD